jgi:hypothetical protein
VERPSFAKWLKENALITIVLTVAFSSVVIGYTQNLIFAIIVVIAMPYLIYLMRTSKSTPQSQTMSVKQTIAYEGARLTSKIVVYILFFGIIIFVIWLLSQFAS